MTCTCGGRHSSATRIRPPPEGQWPPPQITAAWARGRHALLLVVGALGQGGCHDDVACVVHHRLPVLGLLDGTLPEGPRHAARDRPSALQPRAFADRLLDTSY